MTCQTKAEDGGPSSSDGDWTSERGTWAVAVAADCRKL